MNLDLRPTQSNELSSVRVLPMIIILIVSLFSGLIGLKYGTHWDEHYVADSVAYERQLHYVQGWYSHPSVCFDIGMGLTLPNIIFPTFDRLTYDGFIQRARACFFIICMMVIFWIFMAFILTGRSPFSAFVAAGMMGFSWEYIYHSRWIAPDALTAQFAGLVVASILLIQRYLSQRQQVVWIRVATIAVGLAIGTKYNAALLLVPLEVIVYKVFLKQGHARALKEVVIAGLIACLVFLMTTPGILMQPQRALSDILSDFHQYGTGHIGYSVVPGLDHLSKMLDYVLFSIFSSYWPINLFFMALSLVGAMAYIKEDHVFGAVVASFPIFYLGYFSTQKVMIVRNLLIVLPFFAVLAGLGVESIGQRLNGRAKFWAMGFVLVLMSYNAVWLIHSGWTIPIANNNSDMLAARAYIEAHPERRFLVSPMLARMMQPLPENVGLNQAPITQDTLAAFFQSEILNVKLMRANQRDYLKAVFGPLDVNFRYYPTWEGLDRVVMLSAPDARELGINFRSTNESSTLRNIP